ncbi:MAG: hypothetical protein QUS14_17135 [Pyrinomonadaceae bacterium]|nr:hypothetical protein [Pyrinomonadaceae bacterium]
MTEKMKIKVIKKGTVKEAVQPERTELRTKRAAAREMVANVTSWVNDFQTRKRDETKIAFEQLFANRPQPTES